MIAKGNGKIQNCANNLLRMFHGEVPYERVKGMNPWLVDKPLSEAAPVMKQDAEWLIKTYEPRATVNNIAVASDPSAPGGVTVLAEIK
jgi:phage baseplate assembly protein W